MPPYLIACLFFGTFFSASAQQLSYVDPAQAYNRLLIEKSNGSYTRINNYKVIGTPYLFGEKHKGNLFAKGETGFNILLSYNTYNQEIEFYTQANPEKPLVKEPELVDSFELKIISDAELTGNLKFIHGRILNAKEKFFYQVLSTGPKFNLFKKYTSTLGVVSTNYIQSELRQFDLNYEYYYLNNQTKEFKKLKVSEAGLKKEFKQVKDISFAVIEEQLGYRPEAVLKELFVLLNN